MSWIRLFLFLFLTADAVSTRIRSTVPGKSNTSTPIVLWHGMGDNCCLPFSMGAGGHCELYKVLDPSDGLEQSRKLFRKILGQMCMLGIGLQLFGAIITTHRYLSFQRSLMIGSNPTDDQYNGFFMPIDEQIKYACGILSSDARLQGGFHAVGFSQVSLPSFDCYRLPPNCLHRSRVACSFESSLNAAQRSAFDISIP